MKIWAILLLAVLRTGIFSKFTFKKLIIYHDGIGGSFFQTNNFNTKSTECRAFPSGPFRDTAIVKRGPDEETTGILAEDGEQELLSAAVSARRGCCEVLWFLSMVHVQRTEQHRSASSIPFLEPVVPEDGTTSARSHF